MERGKKALARGAAALGLAAAAGVYGTYRYIFYSPVGNQNDDTALPFRQDEEQAKRALALIGKLNARPYEAVSIRSFDGLRLSGRIYRARAGAPVAVLCHGYRGTPSRDFSGGAAVLLEMGLNVLLVEQRAHCSSGGHTISFGINERYDCRDWCRYAAERFGAETPILLAGISMGAATVLMASALDLPENVRGIIADCPYTAPRAIISRVGREMGLPGAAVGAAAALAARTFGRFDLDAADAAEAVRSARVPVLLIHGEADGFVPCEMSREIAAANPPVGDRKSVVGGQRVDLGGRRTARNTALVRAFCERVLNEEKK